MIDLDPQATAVLALAACAAAALLAVAVSLLALRLRVVSRSASRASARHGGDGHDPASLESLRADVLDVANRTGELRDVVRSSVSRVGMVRYDAFEDMGGALSFSAALLDERGDGLVLSAINGRSETRCYAKPIARGESEHELSIEETAAIDTAVSGGGLGQVVPMRRRRRRTS